MAYHSSNECIAITGTNFRGLYHRLQQDHNKHPAYQSSTGELFIFHDGKSKWRITAKLGDTACYGFNDSNVSDVSKAHLKKAWQIYNGKVFERVPGMQISKFYAKDPSGAPKYLIVSGRVGVNSKMNGGYVLQSSTNKKRPVYYNEEADMYIYFNGTAWFISREVNSPAAIALSYDFDANDPVEINEPWMVYDRDRQDFVEDRAISIVPFDPESAKHTVAKQYSKNLFVDKKFGPVESSIGPIEGVDPKTVEWHRGPRLWPGAALSDIALFDGIEPKDLLQGAVGNCWLIAAISAVAEFPEAIKRLFKGRTDLSEDGRYELTLFNIRKQQWEDVVIDDLIPCKQRKWYDAYAEPVFAKPNGNELWVLLLEKAFAKVIGSYAAMDGGHVPYAWAMMTSQMDQHYWKKRANGEWTRSVVYMKHIIEGNAFNELYTMKTKDTAGNDDMWKVLADADKNNYLISAAICGGSGEMQRDDGLVEGHAFSLIQVYEDAQKGIRLVNLRNPWGCEFEWNGAWSDDCPKWAEHPDVATAVNQKSAADGSFWMSTEDFCARFNEVKISPMSMPVDESLQKRIVTSSDDEVLPPEGTIGNIYKKKKHDRRARREAWESLDEEDSDEEYEFSEGEDKEEYEDEEDDEDDDEYYGSDDDGEDDEGKDDEEKEHRDDDEGGRRGYGGRRGRHGHRGYGGNGGLDELMGGITNVIRRHIQPPVAPRVGGAFRHGGSMDERRMIRQLVSRGRGW